MTMRIGMRLPIVGPGLITKDLIAKDIAPPCPFTTKSGDTQSLLVFRTPGILFHQIKRFLSRKDETKISWAKNKHTVYAVCTFCFETLSIEI